MADGADKAREEVLFHQRSSDKMLIAELVMYSSDEACAEKQLVSRPLRAPKKMHVRKEKK